MVCLRIFIILLGVRAIEVMCRSRDNLVIENLAPRQQVAAIKERAASSIQPIGNAAIEAQYSKRVRPV
jgi:hypothetical protein